MGRAVPSDSAPMDALLIAPSTNCNVPISAEALAACLAWRESALIAAFGDRNPRLAHITVNGRNNRITCRTLSHAISATTRADSQNITAEAVVVRESPAQRTTWAFICDPRI